MAGLTKRAIQAQKPRNEKIVKLYRTGDYTLAEVGKLYNLKRQRIHQIIEEVTQAERTT
jgi:predicted DNA-binding protein YlxM (UPF0122 family)